MVLPFCNTPMRYGPAAQFFPKGKLIGLSRENPYHPENVYKVTWAVRCTVGFKVKNRTLWDMDDIIKNVRAYLRAQKIEEAGTFVLQKGVYTHHDIGFQEVITESSCQIVIINTWGEKNFIAWAKAFGEFLRKRFKQSSVIVEVQRNGVVKYAAQCTA